jgi:hypothetical protein
VKNAKCETRNERPSSGEGNSMNEEMREVIKNMKKDILSELKKDIESMSDKPSKVPLGEKLQGYIYLLREREHVISQRDVYKVGRTTQKPDTVIGRIKNGYKKGSEIVLLIQCDDDKIVAVEGKIIEAFFDMFVKHDDGKEHFYGSPKCMRQTIVRIIDEVADV